MSIASWTLLRASVALCPSRGSSARSARPFAPSSRRAKRKSTLPRSGAGTRRHSLERRPSGRLDGAVDVRGAAAGKLPSASPAARTSDSEALPEVASVHCCRGRSSGTASPRPPGRSVVRRLRCPLRVRERARDKGAPAVTNLALAAVSERGRDGPLPRAGRGSPHVWVVLVVLDQLLVEIVLQGVG